MFDSLNQYVQGTAVSGSETVVEQLLECGGKEEMFHLLTFSDVELDR